MKKFRVNMSSNIYFNCSEYTVIIGEEKKSQSKSNINVWIKLIMGAIIGFVNGFWGGGGGMICVPLLMRLVQNPKRAHATTLLVMLPLSLVSIVVYVFSGAVSWLQVAEVGIGFVVGGIVGANVLKVVSNVWLEFIFAGIIIWSGVRMII